MKKIFLAAFALFAFGTSQAQLGNLLNKGKDKAKAEAEKALAKKEEKTANAASTNTTNTEQQTAQPQVANYTKLNDDAYIKTLDEKSMQVRMVRLDGTYAEAINGYYDKARELDMAHFYPVMQKKGKPSDYNAGLDYEEVMKFRNEYPAQYQNSFHPLLNGTIEGAYKLKKENKLQAVANLQAAMHLNEACLLVIPDLIGALEIKADLEKAYTDIAGEQSKVFTSDFHKQNAGKILFSKELIVIGKERPEQFVTSFGPNDNIYAMAYLPGTVRELSGVRDGDNTVLGQYTVKLDGQEMPGLSWLDFKHNKEDWGKAWFPIEVRPDPAKAVHGLDATYFAARFAEFSPRKHTFGIALTSNGNPSAYGELKIDWTAGDAEKMKADAKTAVTKAQDNYSKTVELNPVFNGPNHAFSDPALSPAALKKAFLAGTPNAVQVVKMITVKEANAAGDWTILRNAYGVIMAKVTAHYTSFVYKAKDGNCYTHYVAQFGRAAEGGGYGPLALNPNGLPDERIACENVK